MVLSTISSRPSRGAGWLYRIPFSGVHGAPHATSLSLSDDVTLTIRHGGRGHRASSTCQVYTVASRYDHCSPSTLSLVEKESQVNLPSLCCFLPGLQQPCRLSLSLSAGLLFDSQKNMWVAQCSLQQPTGGVLQASSRQVHHHLH